MVLLPVPLPGTAEPLRFPVGGLTEAVMRLRLGLLQGRLLRPMAATSHRVCTIVTLIACSLTEYF